MAGITNAMDMNLGKLWELVGTGKPGMLQSLGSQRVVHNWVTEQQQQQNTNCSHQLKILIKNAVGK